MSSEDRPNSEVRLVVMQASLALLHTGGFRLLKQGVSLAVRHQQKLTTLQSFRHHTPQGWNWASSKRHGSRGRGTLLELSDTLCTVIRGERDDTPCGSRWDACLCRQVQAEGGRGLFRENRLGQGDEVSVCLPARPTTKEWPRVMTQARAREAHGTIGEG